MTKIYLIQIVLIVLLISIYDGYNRLGEIKNVDDYLDVCMDGIYQKKKPDSEILYGQCAEWKDRNCCFENTTKELQKPKQWQNFNLDHCGDDHKLSSMCRGHFIQNYCFYECSPNVGPWLVKVNGMKSRKERFYKVPLCEQECNLWWNDCRNDFTCVKNWETDFNWATGTNVCPTQSSCRKIKEVFKDSADFCESVFDNSWKVVKKELCIELYFRNVNPNNEVAKKQAESFFVNGSNNLQIEKIMYLVLFCIITW